MNDWDPVTGEDHDDEMQEHCRAREAQKARLAALAAQYRREADARLDAVIRERAEKAEAARREKMRGD